MIDDQVVLDERQRAIIIAMMQNMPEVVSQAILSDPVSLASLELPTEDSIRLFEHRFLRKDLLAAVRSIADGEPFAMSSANGLLKVEEGRFEPDGSAVLIAGEEAARFANAGLLGQDAHLRRQTLEKLLATEDLSSPIEDRLRGWVAGGPLDDTQFLEVETLVDATPKAVYRQLVTQLKTGLAFNELVPEDGVFFEELLGGPPPKTLGKYRAEWLVRSASLDPVRRARWIALTAPIAVLRGELVVAAAKQLDRKVRLRLARFLTEGLDPLSQVAGFQLAAAEPDDQEFRAVGDAILPQLLDKKHERTAAGLLFLSTALILTGSVSGRAQTLGDWPVYARRLAWHIHASLIVRTFGLGQVDPEVMQAAVGRPLNLNYRLLELCDAQTVPFNLWRGPTTDRIHAVVLARIAQAVAGVPEDKVPAEWTDLLQSKKDEISAGQDALPYMAPSSFDPFEDDWGGFVDVTGETATEMVSRMEAQADTQRVLSDLSNLVVAFDVHADHREALAAAYPEYLKSLEGEQFMHAADLMLQILARWKVPDAAEKIIELTMARTGDGKITDISVPVRFSLLGGASNADEVRWHEKVGEYLTGFAFALPPGLGIPNLLVALQLIGEFAPSLKPHLIRASSYAMLANDAVTPVARSDAKFEGEDSAGAQ